MAIFEESMAAEAPSAYSYQYYNGLKNRRIYFNADVDETIIEEVLMPLLSMDDATSRPVELILNTDGGDAFPAFALCDVIDNVKVPLTITVPAYAFSAGFLILCSGKNNPNVKKRCYAHSLALLHGGEVQVAGNASTVKDTQAFFEKYNVEMRNYIRKNTNLPEKIVEESERKEIYLTAQEMLEYGIVDEIIGN